MGGCTGANGDDVRRRLAGGDTLLTPAEVASLFRVDPKTPVRWAKDGRIPAIRTAGRQHRFWESDVYALLEGGSAKDGESAS